MGAVPCSSDRRPAMTVRVIGPVNGRYFIQDGHHRSYWRLPAEHVAYAHERLAAIDVELAWLSELLDTAEALTATPSLFGGAA